MQQGFSLSHFSTILSSIPPDVKLVVVSKMRPVAHILELYNAGQRAFGENRPLEMKEKYEKLPKDIEWHFIGTLQTNKIKYIAPYVSLIHSIDRFSLLREVDQYAAKQNRIINCLFQFFIAQETTKQGLVWEECVQMLESPLFKTLRNIKIVGVMGMATFTENQKLIREEFKKLYDFFALLKEKYFFNQPGFKEISMGMSYDYKIAIAENSTLLRIGSAIFN
jgi:pyridoxal phosphate enzyme (YggS family)